ncbi:MAG TPA: serine hydrolase [Thermoleophilaceae bacterium]|nr:serine hydrolase [Thermoleophilaceae bacterium]
MKTALVIGALAAAPWSPDVDTARDYARDRAGSVSFTVRTERRAWGYRGDRVDRSASVVKAMLLVSYLNRSEVRGRRLRSGDYALLSPMIRRSNNRAASRVRDIVGNESLSRLARRAGMRRFATAPSWGATRISTADQTRFFLKLDRFVARRHRATALRLLGSVVRSERWGIARARPSGWRLYFKGGWGDYGERDHQVALFERDGRRVAVGIMVTNTPTKAYADRTLEGVARRLLRDLGPDSVPR